MKSVTLCLIFLHQTVFGQHLSTGDNNYVGCFADNPRDRDLGTRASLNTRVNLTVSCISWCRDHYYQYAGVQAGDTCWCGPGFGKHGPGVCDVECGAEECGGDLANSVFMTLVSVSGPPTHLSLTQVTEDSLLVSWSPPESSNGEIRNYRVRLKVVKSFSRAEYRATDRELELTGSDLTARLTDLLPGSQYNISVSARNDRGQYGAEAWSEVWTRVGTPDTPAPPVIVSRDEQRGEIRVRLEQVEDNGGQVRQYQVIVAEGQHPSLQDAPLLNYQRAEAEGRGYWVAAQISPQYLESRGWELSLGDGQLYGGYLNHGPLNSGLGYQVAVRVVQSLNGESKTSVSDLVSADDDHDNIVLRVLDSGDSDQYLYHVDSVDPGHRSGAGSTLITALIVSVVVGAVLLSVAVGVCIVIKRRSGATLRRARSDTQELTQQQHSVGVSTTSAGYDNNSGEILSSELDLNTLKTRCWMIPKNFLEIGGEVLGRGEYGSVIRGQLHSQDRVIWCNTQTINLGSLSGDQRRHMLMRLNTSVSAGHHPNIISLLGLCQELDSLTIVLDQAQPSLKKYCLDSRALDHKPEFASNYNRWSSAREETVLEILTGVADGLRHLADKQIYLGSLCSRNILMAGDSCAKISGHGMSDWSRDGEHVDMSRWSAPEVIMGQASGVKSEVWSLGVVMWEVVTLGATPYHPVTTGDLVTRVMRGMRLPHPLSVSDTLYQLMLNCWMLDSDDRPEVAELVEHLRDMNHVPSQHISFLFQPSTNFSYEPYNPHLELLASNDTSSSSNVGSMV